MKPTSNLLLTWSSRTESNTSAQQVLVTARDGETLIRVQESFGGSSWALFGGIMGGVGGGLGFGVGGALSATVGLAAGLVAFPPAALAGSYFLARPIFTALVRRREASANALAGRLAVRGSRRASGGLIPSKRRFAVFGMRGVGILCLGAIVAVTPLRAQSGKTAATERSVEQVVRDVYDLVSWTDGNTPDWEVVREVFIPQAIVVLRYPPALQVMSVDGFLLDWLRFENQLAERGADGFREKVVSARTTEFGDIAHVHVVYESSIPDSGRPARPGVDLWSLIRVDGRWKVVSVVNELPREGLPIPDFED